MDINIRMTILFITISRISSPCTLGQSDTILYKIAHNWTISLVIIIWSMLIPLISYHEWTSWWPIHSISFHTTRLISKWHRHRLKNFEQLSILCFSKSPESSSSDSNSNELHLSQFHLLLLLHHSLLCSISLKILWP